MCIVISRLKRLKMDLVATKIIVLLLMVVLQVLPGLLPVLLSARMRKNRADLLEKLIGAVLCVGGGVLLATVFIHMTPEVRGKYIPRLTIKGWIDESPH